MVLVALQPADGPRKLLVQIELATFEV